jgi:galactokinase
MIKEETTEVFIPGRLCLIGEHTDWSAAYPCISKGVTIVCSTNEGLYSKCCSIVNNIDNKQPIIKFVHENFINNEKIIKEFKCILNYNLLKSEIKSNNFFNYICGTAAIMIQEYVPKEKLINGIYINNYLTNLPMKKGLSSSAASCVTVVVCFNIIYHLNLDLSQIMEVAYKGERLSGSKCGRMDQCVAMGKNKIAKMEFIGETCSLQIIPNKNPLYFVVADLKSSKNTVLILDSLNSCFPTATTEAHSLFHHYVNENINISSRTVNSIVQGDINELSNCMNESQFNFDQSSSILCPSELSSPVLHNAIGIIFILIFFIFNFLVS